MPVSTLSAILSAARADSARSPDSSGELGRTFGVGSHDVSHGGLFRDAKQSHQFEGIGSLECLVEDPILA